MADTEKKAVQDLDFPSECSFHPGHAWVRAEGAELVVGISDYAQDQLGEVIFVDLPAVGDVFAQGSVFGVVESVKSVSDLIMPVAGEVLAVNSDLEDNPEIINQQPYAAGWLLRIKAESGQGGLLTVAEYKKQLESK